MKKYNLLLPIAGKAQRFIDAGYTMPKALILAKNKHVIDWAMDSIDTNECNLIFMVRVDHVYNFSIDKILKQKFGEDITIVKLKEVTRGALETCTLAREHIDNDLPLIVYTPDVHFGPVFNPETISADSDGFLLTFTANSPDHSYSEYDQDGIVTNVVEKEVISKEANVGLYHFKSGKIFLKLSGFWNPWTTCAVAPVTPKSPPSCKPDKLGTVWSPRAFAPSRSVASGSSLARGASAK